MACRLLDRSAGGCRLTSPGRDLFSGLNQAFDLIAVTTQRVAQRARDDRKVRLIVERDFASFWLAQRIGSFLLKNPGISIEVAAERNGPERGEPGATEATAALRTLVSREMVRCVPVGQGTICDGRSRATNRDRLVAQCFLAGADVGGVMVERGLACDWERFSGGHYVRALNGWACR